MIKIPSLAKSRLVKHVKNLVNYAYPNTRVKAWKSFMLKDEDLRGLASAKHLEEYIGLLEHTTYKKEMAKITQNDIYSIENLLTLNYINQSELIEKIAPKDTKRFFSALNLLHEIELIKLVFNRFDAMEGGRMDIDYSIYSPLLEKELTDFLKAAEDAKTKEDAVELLRKTRYGFLATLSEEEIGRQGYISSALDRYYYSNLWSAMDSLAGTDARCARNLIGKEIVMMNLLIALRSTICSFKAEGFIVEAPIEENKRITELVGKEPEEIAAALQKTRYGKVIKEGLESLEKDKSLVKLELSLRKELLDEYRRIFKGSRANIGTLLGFLKLKEYELRNARAIAVAINNGMSQKDIMELVVL